jgi:hypothetical protein
MQTSDGQTIRYSDPVNNDTMFLAYRVNIIPAPASASVLLGLGLVARRRRR